MIRGQIHEQVVWSEDDKQRNSVSPLLTTVRALSAWQPNRCQFQTVVKPARQTVDPFVHPFPDERERGRVAAAAAWLCSSLLRPPRAV